MTPTDFTDRDERVLVLMPTEKDAERTAAALTSASLACVACKNLADLCRELASGAGTLLLTEEPILRDKAGCLGEALRGQPPWSSLPLVVLSHEGASARPQELLAGVAANVTLIERPVRIRTLLSVVQSALRTRRDQYGIRDALAERERQASERLRLVQELRETDRRKDEFLALLAHELRNPLAPLRNGLQVLRLTADPDDAAQARGMMDRQLTHMVRLIDDLLDVSRINRNKMELRRTRVSFAEVVSNAVETARPLIEAAGHDLSVVLPPEPIFLNADLTRLAQVFANLLTNSAKYTERGGHIWLTAERRGDELVASVSDDGIGIPVESLARIFDMFSQVDRSIERSTGGLGIGLALVKGLLEMHGGTIVALSAGPDQGSTFTVRLPVLAAAAEPAVGDAADANGRATRPARRILVVDDNRDSADSMALMLKLLGNEVTTAHDGIEAVTVAERFGPDVVLMDVGMPRLNGYEATRRIRREPWGRAMTVIALTGWGQDGDRARSKAAGCDGHLVKPVSLADLEKLLMDLANG